jgi:hypothetical protein
LSYKDYQISAAQQGMLDSDGTWVTPNNINKNREEPLEFEEPVLPNIVANDQDHPPLSSPETPASQPMRGDDPQFSTQAPPVMGESQFRKMQDKVKEPDVGDTSEENPYEWELSPQVANVTPTPKFISAAQKSKVEEEGDDELHSWEDSSPTAARAKRVFQLLNLS